MDLVHDRGSMDPVHESGPWTWSKVGVHGPLVHVLSSPVLDLWPSTDGLFSRQLNTISFENDSELTYGIILTNFGIAFAFALPRFTQLKCKHKRKCKQKEMTFFLFLASALGWPLGFLFPFRTQPKKTLGTGLNHTCCVELRYGCCVVALYCVCIYAFMGHFQRGIFVLYFVPAFTKYRKNKKFLRKSFSWRSFFRNFFS